jgi:hypothetical protein
MMADEIRRDEAGLDEPGGPHRVEGDPAEAGGVTEPGGRVGPASGSPLGTDPQEASPLPGDPREAQEPQEPRSTHIGEGREGAEPRRASSRDEEDEEGDRGVVDQLREAWDKLRGKD